MRGSKYTQRNAVLASMSIAESGLLEQARSDKCVDRGADALRLLGQYFMLAPAVVVSESQNRVEQAWTRGSR